MIDKLYPENKADLVWQDGGLTYSILNCRGSHYCGYVRLKKRLVKYESPHYNGIYSYIPVHGGITFASEDEQGVIYGFDCAHSGDEKDPKTKDIDWLKKQCVILGEALLISNKYRVRYIRALTNKTKGKVLDEFRAQFPDKDEGFNFGMAINLLGGQL